MNGTERLYWLDDFDSGPLSRGKTYFERGLVEDLHMDAHAWHATVRGTLPYDVVVEVDEQGRPDPYGPNTTCTCPYVATGGPCKHIAAVCFSIEREGAPAPSSNSSAQWKTIFNSLTEEDCRAFLHDTVSRQPNLQDELVARFGEPDMAQIRRAMQSGISSAVYRYSDGYGYVDWHHSLALETEVCAVIREVIQPYLDRRAWQVAFDASLIALEELRKVEVDDSDGYYSTAQDACFDVWRAIVAQGDDGADVVAAGIPRFLLVDPDDDDDYDVLACQQSDAVGLFFEAFQDDPRHAGDVYAYCAAALRAGTCNWMWNGKRRYALAGLRAMHAMGRSIDDRIAFARPYLSLLPVRLQLADSLASEGRCDEAMRLLREGLNVCEQPSDIVAIYKALLNCNELQNDRGETERCLRELLHRTADAQDAVTWWHRLRELVGEDAWETESQALLPRLQVSIVRHALLAEEGRIAELMDELEARPDVHELRAYDQLLAKDYLPRVTKLYIDKVLSDLERASSRNGYRAALQHLAHMATLPGSQAAFERTAQEIRATYPRRPALRDELSKIGG